MSFAMKLEFLIWRKLHLEQLLSGKRILGRNHDQLCPWCQCKTCLTGFLLETPYMGPVFVFHFFPLNTPQLTAEHQSPPHPVLKGLKVIFPTMSDKIIALKKPPAYMELKWIFIFLSTHEQAKGEMHCKELNNYIVSWVFLVGYINSSWTFNETAYDSALGEGGASQVLLLDVCCCYKPSHVCNSL